MNNIFLFNNYEIFNNGNISQLQLIVINQDKKIVYKKIMFK